MSDNINIWDTLNYDLYGRYRINFSCRSLLLSTDFAVSQFSPKLFLLNSSNSVNHFKIQNWFGYCRHRNRNIPNNSNGKYIFFTTLLSCVQIVIYSKWYINGYSLLDLFMVWMGYSKVIDQMLVIGCPYFTWYIYQKFTIKCQTVGIPCNEPRWMDT